MLEGIEAADTLVVTGLDRIGCDSIDAQKTLELCAASDIRLIVLQLGDLDLTSSSRALMVRVLAAVADFQRELIVERSSPGQARARAERKHMGRPPKSTEAPRWTIRSRLAQGHTGFGGGVGLQAVGSDSEWDKRMSEGGSW
jgi:putative DNA-invertase from lambdoid prophage Rac